MKTKKEITINAAAYHVQFCRMDKETVRAVINAETPGKRDITIRLTFPFSCAPYWIPELKKQWLGARENRVNELNRIDNAFPQ